jgi:hypothetical protein
MAATGQKRLSLAPLRACRVCRSDSDPRRGVEWLNMVDGDPPNLTRLIAALTRLGDRAAAERQASTIYPIINAVVFQKHSRGHDIGRDARGFYARPRTSTAGPARELRDLCVAANKAIAGRCDKEDWITAWAAVPDRTQHRLWGSPLIQKTRLFGSFSAPGYLTNVPRPDDALPA